MLFFIAKHSGTKGEKNRLEDQFVAGSCSPPFVTPPKKKVNYIKNKTKGRQPKKETKENKNQREKQATVYIVNTIFIDFKLLLDKILVVTDPDPPSQVNPSTEANDSFAATCPNLASSEYTPARNHHVVSLSSLLAIPNHHTAMSSYL